MKHLKLFEAYKEPEKGDPVIGDWVVLKDLDFIDYPAQIVGDVSSTMATFRTYQIRIHDTIQTIWDSEIEFHSKSKQDCEAYIEANKYNL